MKKMKNGKNKIKEKQEKVSLHKEVMQVTLLG